MRAAYGFHQFASRLIACRDARSRRARAGPDHSSRAGTYRVPLNRLTPAATFRLAPGDYLEGLPIQRLRGTAEAPIRIDATRERHDAMCIADSSFVETVGLNMHRAELPVDVVKAARQTPTRADRRRGAWHSSRDPRGVTTTRCLKRPRRGGARFLVTRSTPVTAHTADGDVLAARARIATIERNVLRLDP